MYLWRGRLVPSIHLDTPYATELPFRGPCQTGGFGYRPLDVDPRGELVQGNCFCIRRLGSTRGAVRKRTAIHVASAYIWAELHAAPRNPSARPDVGPRPSTGG